MQYFSQVKLPAEHFSSRSEVVIRNMSGATILQTYLYIAEAGLVRLILTILRDPKYPKIKH